MMDVARLDKQKSQLWWTVTILMIMCMYWLSNVVLWVPWSHNPQLGILLMLTVILFSGRQVFIYVWLLKIEQGI